MASFAVCETYFKRIMSRAKQMFAYANLLKYLLSIIDVFIINREKFERVEWT